MFLFHLSNVVVPFYFPISSVWEFQVLYFLGNIWYVQFLIVDIFIYKISNKIFFISSIS